MNDEEQIELQIHLARDEESGWWYVAHSDIPGLVLEAETAAALIQKIEAAAPEMIELNHREIVGRDVAGERERAEPRAVRQAWRPVFDSPLGAYA